MGDVDHWQKDWLISKRWSVGADVTQFRKGMRDIRNEVGFLSETMSGIAGLGRSLTFAFTTPVLAIGTAAISAASGFEASMYNINSIAGLTADQLDMLSQKTLEFGARTRSGAQAASEALYTVFSAGITNVDDAFAVMQVATQTAEAGLADLTITTEGLVAILLSYGDTSEQAAMQASDAITRMVALGVGSMQTFMTALSSVVPTASAIGMEFDDLAADMAFLTQRGLSASRAGVSMNAVLTQMLNPTEAMSAAFSELGAKDLPALITQVGGVNEAIQALIGTAEGDVGVLFEMFNSIQARRAIGLFAEGQEAWQQTLAEFEQGVAGSTARAWEEQMKSFAATWDLLMAAVQGAGIAIGQTMLPVLQPFVAAITDLLLVIVDTNPELLGMAAGFVTVAAAIPPLLWLIGSLVTPFGLVLGAVSALVVAFANDFGGIATSVRQTVDSVIAELQPLTDTLTDFWNTVFPKEVAADEGGMAGVLPDPATYITVEEPSSLWEIYESQGWASKFSWNEFMEAAMEGGWGGGVIDVGDFITIEGGNAIQNAAINVFRDIFNFDDATDEVRSAAGNVLDRLVPKSFWDRIAEGAATAWPLIQQQLNTLWESFTGWFDGKAASVITLMSSWFDNSTLGSTIYTAWVNLLNGNIIGAINAVFPTVGTTIANAIGDINLASALPQTTTAFSAFFTNIKDWIRNEGVPLISQGLGYLVGRVGVVLGDALEGVFGYFTGGGAGDAASYFGEAVSTPFMEGFNQALDGSQVTNPAERLLNGLLGGIVAISAANVLLFQPAATAIMAGLQLAASALSWIPFSLGIIGKIATALKITAAAQAVWTPIATAVTTALGSAMTTAAAGVTAATSWVASVGASILGAITAVLTSPITIGIALGVGTYLIIPPEVSTSIRNALGGIFDAVFGEGSSGMLNTVVTRMAYMLATVIAEIFGQDELAAELRLKAQGALDGAVSEPFTISPLETTTTATLEITNISDVDVSASASAVQTLALAAIDTHLLGSLVGEDGYLTVEDVDLAMRLSNPNMTFAPLTGQDIQQMAQSGELTELQTQLAGMGFDLEISPMVTVTLDNVTYTTGVVDAGGMSAAVDFVDTEPMTAANPIVVQAPVELQPISVAFAEDIAGGTDVETIIAENFVPLQDAWVAMFAAEGLMATTFNTFSSGVATGWQNISTEMTSMADILSADIPEAIGIFEGAKDPFIENINAVKTALSSARAEADGLKSSIEALLNLEGTLDVSVTVTGETPDGSHKTGLMSVPYDGYLAELHKGEMVLTKNEASAYRDADISTEASLPVTRNSTNTTNNNQVTIQGNLTVDQMIYELKRRGIDLTKVK